MKGVKFKTKFQLRNLNSQLVNYLNNRFTGRKIYLYNGTDKLKQFEPIEFRISKKLFSRKIKTLYIKPQYGEELEYDMQVSNHLVFLTDSVLLDCENEDDCEVVFGEETFEKGFIMSQSNNKLPICISNDKFNIVQVKDYEINSDIRIISQQQDSHFHNVNCLATGYKKVYVDECKYYFNYYVNSINILSKYNYKE